jgi:hypothetical protein
LAVLSGDPMQCQTLFITLEQGADGGDAFLEVEINRC